MGFLLDGLHEDLNRAKKKPFVSKIESKYVYTHTFLPLLLSSSFLFCVDFSSLIIRFAGWRVFTYKLYHVQFLVLNLLIHNYIIWQYMMWDRFLFIQSNSIQFNCGVVRWLPILLSTPHLSSLLLSLPFFLSTLIVWQGSGWFADSEGELEKASTAQWQVQDTVSHLPFLSSYSCSCSHSCSLLTCTAVATSTLLLS